MEARIGHRRVLIVEDDHLTAALLADLLTDHGFLVEIADTTAAARQSLDTFDPDAVLLDIVLGDGPSGVALSYLIAREYPGTAILFLTRYPDPHSAGVAGLDIPADCAFLRKDRVHDTGYLIGALEATLRDRHADYREDLTANTPLSVLTPNQRQVLRLVAQGLTNAAIAHRRGTTSSAVEQSLSSIFRNLGIQTHDDLNPRMQAARIYIAAAGLPEDL